MSAASSSSESRLGREELSTAAQPGDVIADDEIAAPGDGNPTRREIDKKIVAGMGWGAISLGGTQALSMVGMLVLARLLTPTAFGLMALTWTFLYFLQSAQESGLWSALVHRREGMEAAAASVALATPLIGIVLGASAFGAAPLIAHLFHSAALTGVVRAMALVLVVSGCAVAPHAILERELDFRSLTKIDISMSIAQFAVAIPLAALGFGVWSLVFGAIASAGVKVVLAWTLVPWRPSLRAANYRTLRELAGYGRFISSSQMINLLSRSLDNITVGRVLGAAPLGRYAVGYRLAVVPVDFIGRVVSRPMFAAYAALQHDRDGFRSIWIQTVQRIAVFSSPASVWLAFSAKPLVLALLGPKWVAAVAPLRLLALQGMFRGFASINGDLWQGIGKPAIRLRLEITHIALLVPALVLLTPRYGLVGAASAMLIVESLSGSLAVGVSMWLLRVRIVELAAALVSPLACCGVLAVTLAVLLPALSGLAPAAELAILCVAGPLVYLVAVLGLARNVVSPMLMSLRAARSGAG